jgi:hypothetical protein
MPAQLESPPHNRLCFICHPVFLLVSVTLISVSGAADFVTSFEEDESTKPFQKNLTGREVNILLDSIVRVEASSENPPGEGAVRLAAAMR